MKVAILGYGTVGSGVFDVLTENRDIIAKRVGFPLDVKYVLDLREFPGKPVEKYLTHDFRQIIEDPEIDIIVEVMGGIHPSYEYAKEALESGRSVCTSNKELVAAYGAELLALAKENNVNFLFEASVGGGIPIIRPMNQCLVANIVDEIAGILNGTTNFILTKMIEDGMQFADALKLAQELGFAEKDPTADIEGHDACRKICILASLAFGKHVYPDSVHTEGITKITLEDVKYAEKFGCVIKLIGRVKKLKNNKIDIITAPMLVPLKSQLANIDNEFNGIMVRGDCTGDVVFYGKGAGKLPTASAVVADIVDCCQHLKKRRFLFWTNGNGSNIINVSESVFAMYVRVKGKDAIAKAEGIFGAVQSLSTHGGDRAAFTTKAMSYGEFTEKINKLASDGVEILSTIRIGDL